MWDLCNDRLKKNNNNNMNGACFFYCIKICFPICHPQELRRSQAFWRDELKTLSFKNNKSSTAFFFAFRVRFPFLCTQKEYKLKARDRERDKEIKRKKQGRKKGKKRKKEQGVSIKIVSLVIDWKNSQMILLWQSHDKATFWGICFFFYLH